MGISHHPGRNTNGITKADWETRKSEDLLNRDFSVEVPLTKCVSDITEIKTREGKWHVSVIVDFFDFRVIGLATDTNMKVP